VIVWGSHISNTRRTNRTVTERTILLTTVTIVVKDTFVRAKLRDEILTVRVFKSS
jgi:hypothetical protein